MKRLHIVLALLLCCALLWMPAMAADSASHVISSSTVDADGSCLVSITVQLHLDAAANDLTFPIPARATDILLSGSPAQTTPQDSALLVRLPAMNAGDHTLSLSYRLTGTVDTKKGLLTLPLLSGFGYPIESMEFSVTLPGPVTGEPSFTSGYHQQHIQSNLITSVSDNTLYGTLRIALKDHETLTMELPVDPALFAAAPKWQLPQVSPWDWCLMGSTVLAAVYFCVTLLPRFSRRTRCFTAPDGIAAGQIGTCLTGCGTDLTMTVITWAQLGYLTIELSGRERVLLHKRMDMGNERSDFEVRCFQKLFSRRTTVDGTGLHYAKLCRQVAGKSALLPLLYHPKSGNPRIFRLLCCAAGVFSGVQLGVSVEAAAGVRTMLAILFGGLCAVLCYFIQSGGKCLPLRDKTPLWIALGCGTLWLVLGGITGNLATVIPVVLFQLLAGLGVAYGGKRSQLGQRYMAQIRGLRHHMCTAKTFDLQQIMQKNPNYFYELAPYALALGVDRNFARRFGKIPLPETDCLTGSIRRDITAAQWANHLRHAADLLNKRQKRLPYERLTGK